MNKLVKTILFSLVLMFAVFSIANKQDVKAAETTDSPETATLIYVEAPDTWANINVWAFHDTENSFDSWPGKSLKADPNNDGWYYGFVKSNTSKVIINGKSAEEDVQTEALDITGNSWITIAEDKSAVVSTGQETAGLLPTYVPTMNIKAYIPKEWDSAGLWAWKNGVNNSQLYNAWPGEEMTLGADGWYLMEDVPQDITAVIVNEAVDGGLQTSDAVIDTTKLGDKFIPTVYAHVVVGTEADTYALDLYYNEMPDVTPKFTVHAKIPDTWVLPCIWAWSHPDGTNAFPNWPGAEMVEETNGWYTMQVSEFVNRIIISGNLGDVQTLDVDIEAKELWIVVASEAGDDGKYEAAVTYTKPAESIPGDKEEPVEPIPGDKEEPVDTLPSDNEPENNSVLIITFSIIGVVVLVGAIGFVVYKRK